MEEFQNNFYQTTYHHHFLTGHTKFESVAYQVLSQNMTTDLWGDLTELYQFCFGPKEMGMYQYVYSQDWSQTGLGIGSYCVGPLKPDYIDNKSAIVTPAKYHDAVKIKSNLKLQAILYQCLILP